MTNLVDAQPPFQWIYCYDGKSLPPLYSTRVCVFKTIRGAHLESCVLLEDVYNHKSFWVIKGDVNQKEVYPFAWLKIGTEFPEYFFDNLALLGQLSYFTGD